MWRRFRPPLVVLVGALLGLIVLLAVFQYRWLGQISEAERAQSRASLAAGATEFAQDFDREITRAYLLFQGDPPGDPLSPREGKEDPSYDERFAAKYDRWQESSRFPRLLKDVYSFTQDDDGKVALRRYDPASRGFVQADWPASMADWRKHLGIDVQQDAALENKGFFIRRLPAVIWESVPAIVAPVPTFFLGHLRPLDNAHGKPSADWVKQALNYSLIVIDREYVAREMLPALAARHFGRQGNSADGVDYKVAVVRRDEPARVIFQSSPSFAPRADATADAAADLFQVRTQDFTSLAAEVRKYAAFVSTRSTPERTARAGGVAQLVSEGRPVSVVIQPPKQSGAVTNVTTTRLTGPPPISSHWRLVVAHPAGSLEAAVASQRRRNLAISSTILGLLVTSMALLVLSTRRAQRLAKQQMEFVAAVSHELRTPLAVIRSAAENLADGVVYDEVRIRRYGELMRTEGRRLTEMVEQILELAGIQSGQRGFALRPVAIAPLLRDVVSASSDLVEKAGLKVELDMSDPVPLVLGDEAALRRVFQNLFDNAIKYGGSGGSIRISARRDGQNVTIGVADQGIGIDPAEQARIFEPFYRAPDVVAAQVQGAGLGLSLVQRIVVAHGGRVTVKSMPRTGSEFTVHLPASDRPAAERAASNRQASESSPSVEAARSS